MTEDQVGSQSIFSKTKESREERRKALRDSRRSCLYRLSRYKLSSSANGVNGTTPLNGADAKPEEEDQPST